MMRLTPVEPQAFAVLAADQGAPDHAFDGRQKHWQSCTLCEHEAARRADRKAFHAACRPGWKPYPWPLWHDPKAGYGAKPLATGPIPRAHLTRWQTAAYKRHEWDAVDAGWLAAFTAEWDAGTHPWTRTTAVADTDEPVDVLEHPDQSADACPYCGALPNEPQAAGEEHPCPVCGVALTFLAVAS